MPDYPSVRIKDFELDTDEEVRIFKQKIRNALENIPFHQEGEKFVIYSDTFCTLEGEIEQGGLTVWKKMGENEGRDMSLYCQFSVKDGKICLPSIPFTTKSAVRNRSEYFARELLKEKRKLQIKQDEDTQSFLKQIKDVFENIRADAKEGMVLLDNDFFTLTLAKFSKEDESFDIKIECCHKTYKPQKNELVFSGKNVDGRIVLTDYDEDEVLDAFGKAYYAYKEMKKAKNDPQAVQARNKCIEALKKINTTSKEGDIIYEDQYCKLCLGDIKEDFENFHSVGIRFFNKITQEYYHSFNSINYDVMYISNDDGPNIGCCENLADTICFMHYLSSQREEQINDNERRNPGRPQPNLITTGALPKVDEKLIKNIKSFNKTAPALRMVNESNNIHGQNLTSQRLGTKHHFANKIIPQFISAPVGNTQIAAKTTQSENNTNLSSQREEQINDNERRNPGRPQSNLITTGALPKVDEKLIKNIKSFNKTEPALRTVAESNNIHGQNLTSQRLGTQHHFANKIIPQFISAPVGNTQIAAKTTRPKNNTSIISRTVPINNTSTVVNPTQSENNTSIISQTVPINNTSTVVDPTQSENNTSNNTKQDAKRKKSYAPSFILGASGAASFAVGVVKKDSKIVLIVACSIGAVCLIGSIFYSVYVYRNNKDIINKFANNDLKKCGQKGNKNEAMSFA